MHTNGLYTANKTAPPPQATQARGPKPHQGKGVVTGARERQRGRQIFSSPLFFLSTTQILNFDFPLPTCALSLQLVFSHLPNLNSFWFQPAQILLVLETGSPPAVPHHPRDVLLRQENENTVSWEGEVRSPPSLTQSSRGHPYERQCKRQRKSSLQLGS